MKTKMLTNRKPNLTFDWDSDYNPGKYLRISQIPEHDWFDPMSILLLQLSIDSTQELDMLLERSIQSERVTIQKILDLLAAWDEQAYNTAILLEAEKISGLAPPNHTNNQWQNTKSKRNLSVMRSTPCQSLSARTPLEAAKLPLSVGHYALIPSLVSRALRFSMVIKTFCPLSANHFPP